MSEPSALRDTLLVELPAGTRLDDPDGWIYEAIAEIGAAQAVAEFGSAETAWSAREMAAMASRTTHDRQTFAILVDAASPRRPLGYALAKIPVTSNTHLAAIDICVLMQYRRAGLGTRLLDWAEGVAAAAGRTTLLIYAALGDGAANEPQVAAPQGGSIRASAPCLPFARRHGYRLEQVDRRSVLDLPLDASWLDALRADAAGHADGYRLHVWSDGVPARWRAGFAAMLSVFVTQAPSAGVDITDEFWDESRVVESEQMAADMGRTELTAAVEHVASGRLVGATQLSCPHDTPYDSPACVFQDETIVLPGHRGHRLGMWMKAVNLQQLAALRPATRRVYTWNAAENDHMLAINEQLGFHPSGAEASLQKKVAR
jgi:GNAT superfamily N-acetyltransferase